METLRTITYDDKTSGRKAFSFPPELPFAEHMQELLGYLPASQTREDLFRIASQDDILERSLALGDYISSSEEPHKAILGVAALAASGEQAGLRLIYASLLSVPPAESLVEKVLSFKNVRRVMRRIEIKKLSGRQLKESEQWFEKKAMLLSMSHPLPGPMNAPKEAPWLDWSDGIRRAISEPSGRWNDSIIECIRIELEALDLRIKIALAAIDISSKARSSIYLASRGGQTLWHLKALEKGYCKFGSVTLVLREKLGAKWEQTIENLRSTRCGLLCARLFELQLSKAHSYLHVELGTSVIRALLLHPLLNRAARKPDYMSCIATYLEFAGEGILQAVLKKSSASGFEKTLRGLSGFSLDEELLTINVSMVAPAPFIDSDGVPREVEWTNLGAQQAISWRALVLSYMDNDNFIVELLNNPRVASRPGIVPLIALKSRSSRVLSIIANTHSLYTGFSNKEVPVNLLMNPAKIPLSAIRKFIHVRFVDKPTLARLAGKGSQIREEVRREIQHYLSSLK